MANNSTESRIAGLVDLVTSCFSPILCDKGTSNVVACVELCS